MYPHHNLANNTPNPKMYPNPHQINFQPNFPQQGLIYPNNCYPQLIPQVSDRLNSVSCLNENQYIVSSNSKYYARLQQDGNFVIYTSSNFNPSNAIWSSQTNGKGVSPYHLKMQDDGNLVLYDRNNTPTWASNTWNKGQGPWQVVMQNDGNLVVYDKFNNPTWASNTSR